MLKTKYSNPLDGFVCHGIQTATISGEGTYTYVLLIDMTGQALIRRISQDQSEILYTLMPNPETGDQGTIASAIDNFWANYTQGNFTYLFQV